MDRVATPKDSQNGLIDELMRAQFDLYAYIVVLLGGTEDAYDVLQETNRQIVGVSGQKNDVVHFLAWAKRLAYFQVRTWRTKQHRDRLVFDDVLFEQLAASLPERDRPASEKIHALNTCLKKLPERMRELFLARHVDGQSVQALAAVRHRPPESVSVTLHRARQALRDCIRKQVAMERVRDG